jgi:uncharacterized membrane protein
MKKVLSPMQRFASLTGTLTLFLIFLLLFLVAFESRVALPLWLKVAGRLHPMVLHLPIGMMVFSVIMLFMRKSFRKKAHQAVLLCVLSLTSLTAAVTAILGFFLSLSGDYGHDALQQHKIGGILFALICYGLQLVYRYSLSDKRIVYSISLITLIALIIAGHTGSVLTHGEDYILIPLQEATTAAPDPEQTSVYAWAVKPVLEKKCFSCHNASKAKGLLIMTSDDQFKRGGKQGKAWVEGKPERSRMIQYVHLPMDDEFHMPPEGKPQLTAFEIRLLEAWILAGADFDKKLLDYAATDTLTVLAKQMMNRVDQHPTPVTNTFTAASSSQLEKLNTAYRTVTPLYRGSPALQADFFVSDFYKPESLRELVSVSEQLVRLNVAKMPVTDDDLNVISQFKNLEKLNLNFTAITGDQLFRLVALEKLVSLSLSGTPISAKQLEPVLAIPSLKEVIIWNKGITAEAVADLKRSYPHITIIHTLVEETGILALSKPQLMNDGVIRTSEALTLRHTMKDVTIRYTLDGTAPDSVTGLVYGQPLELRETITLNAVACKPGWYCSERLSTVVFVEGNQPVRAELLSPADKKYPGRGAASLTDLRKGFTDNVKEPSWLGYRDHAFEAGFDFGSAPPTVQKIVISYGDNLGAYIFPPTVVEVWGGTSKEELNRLVVRHYPIPERYRSGSVQALTLSFSPAAHAYYKLIARPISKLPEWHGGKGERGWFFVDEVFFY